MDLASRIRQYGLNIVYDSPNALVDIVFVHGLNGHPHRTWTSAKTGTFWPVDLLPDVLSQNRVRILSYGYNANVTSFTDGASKDRILNHSETLAASLAANRTVCLFAYSPCFCTWWRVDEWSTGLVPEDGMIGLIPLQHPPHLSTGMVLAFYARTFFTSYFSLCSFTLSL